MEQFREWHEILIERLSIPDRVLSYLEFTLEEYLNDGNKLFFLSEIGNVVEAQGGVSVISEKSGIDPKILSDIIYNISMPSFDIIESIFKCFGGTYPVDLKPLESEFTKPSDLLIHESKKILNKETNENTKLKTYTKREFQNIEYWKRFDKCLEFKEYKTRLPAVSKSNYQNLKIGVRGFALRAIRTTKYKNIRASLIMRGKNLIRNFYALRVQDEEIEEEFGHKLEWHSKAKTEKSIYLTKPNVDPSDENDWDNQHIWLVDMIEKMHNVFYPRIRKLA